MVEQLNTPEVAARRLEAKALVKSANGGRQRIRKGVGPDREGAIIARALEMPLSSRNTYLAAINGDSPTSAVKAFCAECVGWVRNEVTHCTATACPLWPYRPYQAG